MCARDQSSIFSTGGKFRPDYGLQLLELHVLTLVARSYVLLPLPLCMNNHWTTSPIYMHLLFLFSGYMLIWTQGHPWVEKCEWSEPSAESGTPWLRPLQHQPR